MKKCYHVSVSVTNHELGPTQRLSMYKVSAGLLKWTRKEHNRATALEMHAEIYERKPTNGCRGNMLVQQRKM